MTDRWWIQSLLSGTLLRWLKRSISKSSAAFGIENQPFHLGYELSLVQGMCFHLCFHNIKMGVFQLNLHNRKWSMLGLQIQIIFFKELLVLRIILSSRFHSKSHQNSTTRPGRGPRGFRRPGRRPGGAGHGEAVAAGLSSAGELRCLGRLFSRRSRWFQNSMIFPNVVEKDIVVIYLYITYIYIYTCISICIFICMCICTYIRTHDMCIFVFVMSYPFHPNKIIPPIDGPHILHQLNRWNN